MVLPNVKMPQKEAKWRKTKTKGKTEREGSRAIANVLLRGQRKQKTRAEDHSDEEGRTRNKVKTLR